MSEAASSLIRKLCEIGASLSYIEKRGKNTFHVYKYATEADIVSAIRREMFTRQVFLTPSFKEHKREQIERQSGSGDKVKLTRTALTDVMIEWTWRDGESGETLACLIPGCGEDSGDKGTYKAFTGSEKYLLLKTFLIPTYDDAEQLTATDKKALQQRVAAEKQAEMQAKKDSHHAQSPEDAAKIAARGKVVFITMPDRFNGEFAAVYGNGIQSEDMIKFFFDCNAQKFKGPEGIFFKLEAQYVSDCKTMVERLGFTLDAKE
jgi:hypothetical protein